MYMPYTEGGRLYEPLVDPDETPKQFLQRSVFNSAELMRQQFPPTPELAAGLISTGLVYLVAAPKIGKSWLALHLALAASTGGKVLGRIPVEPRPVLYLALEDGIKRLQRRLRILESESYPDTLEFIVRLPEKVSAIDVINEYLDHHADESPLVILDTLGAVLGQYPQKRNESAYERDYRISSQLHEVVTNHDGATLLVVHHTRKDPTGDFLDSISGTNGIAGGSDEIIKLSRPRQTGEGILEVTGRDILEGRYAIKFSRGMWTLAGEDLKEAAATARGIDLEGEMKETMRTLIAAVSAHPEGISPSNIAKELGWGPKKNVPELLKRAVKSGKLVKVQYGVYAPVPDTDDQQTSQTESDSQ